MRVLMRERFAVPQAASLFQRLLDFGIGVEYTQTAEQLHVVQKMSRRPDRSVDFKTVPHAGVEVVGAVPRRRVYRAGAGIQRDVVAEHTERGPRVERMLKADLLE